MLAPGYTPCRVQSQAPCALSGTLSKTSSTLHAAGHTGGHNMMYYVACHPCVFVGWLVCRAVRSSEYSSNDRILYIGYQLQLPTCCAPLCCWLLFHTWPRLLFVHTGRALTLKLCEILQRLHELVFAVCMQLVDCTLTCARHWASRPSKSSYQVSGRDCECRVYCLSASTVYDAH